MGKASAKKPASLLPWNLHVQTFFHTPAPALVCVTVHGRTGPGSARGLRCPATQGARTGVSHRARYRQLVSRPAQGCAGVRTQARQFQVRAEPPWLVVARREKRCTGDSLPARRTLEPHRPAVSHRTTACPGLLGTGYRLSRLRPEPGDLPSETSVYEDARVAWERFQILQPVPAKRLIYGHSLGGAVAIDLAAELGQRAAANQLPPPVRGLVIESTFTSLADVATAMANTSLPVRWVLSQKFDSIDKIADIHMPLLVVHGLDDRYVPPRFSQQLFDAAQEPKHLLLVPGASHNNSLSLGGRNYRQALEGLL
ncbi:alpha/beta hydrolase [Pseudomonas brenneri]